MIPAWATIDYLGAQQYEVTVTGHPPFEEHQRTYILKAKDDKDAAMGGIDQFCSEMEALGVGGKPNGQAHF